MSYFDQYSPYILQQSSSLGIPSAVGLGLFAQESNFNPFAVGDNGAAVGIGQLHLGAASDVGVTNRLDPYQSITGSLTYLKQQFNKFGNWTDALAAYNQGAGATGSAWQKGLAYAQSALQKGMSLFGGGSSGSGGVASDATNGAACAAGDVLACASLANSALGSDGCGMLDFVCKIQKWVSQSSFFERLALATLALLLVLGGLYLMKGSE